MNRPKCSEIFFQKIAYLRVQSWTHLARHTLLFRMLYFCTTTSCNINYTGSFTSDMVTGFYLQFKDFLTWRIASKTWESGPLPCFHFCMFEWLFFSLWKKNLLFPTRSLSVLLMHQCGDTDDEDSQSCKPLLRRAARVSTLVGQETFRHFSASATEDKRLQLYHVKSYTVLRKHIADERWGKSTPWKQWFA